MGKRINIGLVAIAMVGLGACGNAELKAVQADCSVLMAGEEPMEELTRQNISLDDFCTCASEAILALEPGQKDAFVTGMAYMASEIGEGRSAQDIYSALRRESRADEATEEIKALFKSVDDLGEQLEDTLDKMGMNGGVCVSS
ncbi:MAG: hypothetical protein AAGF20_11195 [Pseudomonadota bacterium]